MSTEYTLPRYSDGYRKKTQTQFGGYDHRYGASDGAIYHMENMSGDLYPVASPRKPRVISRKLARPNGIAGYDGVYYVDGTGFYDNGVLIGAVSDTRKCFAFLGKILVILPDKLFYNTVTREFGSLEASWSGTAEFADGTYMEEAAEGCRIVTTGAPFPFKAGDAVTIEGSSVSANNATLIIREISEDKKSLGFYENSFENAKNQALVISRRVPDMDFICQNENRLFGCKGDTIYASKLGDAFNWNVFDGLATDSWALDVGSAGDFTACVAYGGYAIFFKENMVYKVYGDKPSNFQAMSSASLGVMRGADASLAVAGETLYYLSRTGIMAYSGGIPVSISSAFGEESYSAAVGGSDGLKYYVSMKDQDGRWSLFCYDTRYRAWWREDDTQAVGFACYDGLRMLSADGVMYRIGAHVSVEAGEEREGDVKSALEFYDFTEGSPDRKSLCKMQMCIDMYAGAEITVSVSFDGRPYRKVSTSRSVSRTSCLIPVPLHRYDFMRVRIEGRGDWRLSSLTREYSPGSDI